ncbi:MAG: amino acid ABC transporter permease [Pseudomonadota bacterium]
MDWTVAFDYWPQIARGVWATLAMAAISYSAGLVLGLFIALARMSGRWVLTIPTTIFVEFFRTTPPLVQIVWFYFVVPVLTGVELNAFQAATLALALNVAAFLSEVFRGGLASVDSTQRDAGQVLGLSRIQVYRYVLVPQAVRNVMPQLTTWMVLLIKSTSLASAIGALELMQVSKLIALETFRPIEVLTTAAVIYFLLAYPLTLLAGRLERRLQRHTVRA